MNFPKKNGALKRNLLNDQRETSDDDENEDFEEFLVDEEGNSESIFQQILNLQPLQGSNLPIEQEDVALNSLRRAPGIPDIHAIISVADKINSFNGVQTEDAINRNTSANDNDSISRSTILQSNGASDATQRASTSSQEPNNRRSTPIQNSPPVNPEITGGNSDSNQRSFMACVIRDFEEGRNMWLRSCVDPASVEDEIKKVLNGEVEPKED